MEATLTLPWPPSVNHYYRHVGPRVLISKDGRRYRETVAGIARRAAIPTFRAPVEVDIDLYPPDNRRRDVDNSLKCTLDSLTYAGVYEDDSLIRKLTATMRRPEPLSSPAGLKRESRRRRCPRKKGRARP
jgi:Holliday junction resolvase RusA-like endonuclease